MAAHSYRPENLLKELGITKPEEIDIEAIAEFCNATIIPQRLHGSSARIIGFKDRAIITIDSQAKPERQRFSAGHELGHWMQDRGKLSTFICGEKAFAAEWAQDNPERRANRYAKDLLIPEFMFKPLAKNREVTFETVIQLCRQFRTSLTATAIRLIELGSFPAMLVCNSNEGLKWFYRGKDVSSVLWPRDAPGAYTDAFDLLRGKSTANKPVEVQASDWLTHHRSRYYSLLEDSRKITDNLVLSLLWWKNEQQLLDLDVDE